MSFLLRIDGMAIVGAFDLELGCSEFLPNSDEYVKGLSTISFHVNGKGFPETVAKLDALHGRMDVGFQLPYSSSRIIRGRCVLAHHHVPGKGATAPIHSFEFEVISSQQEAA